MLALGMISKSLCEGLRITSNFRRYVVSIRQSKLLTKFEKMWTSPCIAIEDPFELSHNLGAGISRKSKKDKVGETLEYNFVSS